MKFPGGAVYNGLGARSRLRRLSLCSYMTMRTTKLKLALCTVGNILNRNLNPGSIQPGKGRLKALSRYILEKKGAPSGTFVYEYPYMRDVVERRDIVITDRRQSNEKKFMPEIWIEGSWTRGTHYFFADRKFSYSAKTGKITPLEEQKNEYEKKVFISSFISAIGLVGLGWGAIGLGYTTLPWLFLGFGLIKNCHFVFRSLFGKY